MMAKGERRSEVQTSDCEPTNEKLETQLTVNGEQRSPVRTSKPGTPEQETGGTIDGGLQNTQFGSRK